jgi:hypothetical protein
LKNVWKKRVPYTVPNNNMLNRQIADLIEAEIPDLVQLWADTVRDDTRIISDADLSEGGFKDHVDQVISELCEVLRLGEIPSVRNTMEARLSAYMRFRMGYRARDLACELSLLRITLFHFMNRKLLSLKVDIPIEKYMAACETINLYIDEEIRYAFSIFTESINE